MLVLLFLPPRSLSSSSRVSRIIVVRNGWDTLNLRLVLFAILCGLLSRRSGDDDDAEKSLQEAHDKWPRFSQKLATRTPWRPPTRWAFV
ncbi:hypothetical protein OPV22_029117 [Ensete ventricosum]|uniref:Secreted protein n=1 Tax=Ensete ventricosum TaxID=4639 RepID=A0AAV8QCD7_ENSVE|nr:hypothetical protein OPV22_029117 [Ensete ventricosum]